MSKKKLVTAKVKDESGIKPIIKKIKFDWEKADITAAGHEMIKRKRPEEYGCIAEYHHSRYGDESCFYVYLDLSQKGVEDIVAVIKANDVEEINWMIEEGLLH